MEFESVIGLEIHVQLNTKTKLFCSCPSQFGAPPNKNTCPVCMGYPGVLPKLNKEAVKQILKIAIALKANINKKSIFARKHYFYPDLPKNYQISQYETPIATGGFLNGIKIRRIHLEEDAGKLLHEIGSRKLDFTLVDLNRAGIPLAEIVTEPFIATPQDAVNFLIELRRTLRLIGASTCNMEEGTLRCDANISIRKKGEKELGTKVEIKNMNSFKAVKDALSYEILRQQNEDVIQETRLYDPKTGKTYTMRKKEEAHDYRYFPEPDLLPLVIEDTLIEEIRNSMPHLPEYYRNQFPSIDRKIMDRLLDEVELIDYFVKAETYTSNKKMLAEFITTNLLGILNRYNMNINNCPLKPEEAGKLIEYVTEGKINYEISKRILNEIFENGKNLSSILKEYENIKFDIDELIDEAIETNKKAVNDLKSGKENAIQVIIGYIMKKTKGSVDAKSLKEKILTRILNS